MFSITQKMRNPARKLNFPELFPSIFSQETNSPATSILNHPEDEKSCKKIEFLFPPIFSQETNNPVTPILNHPEDEKSCKKIEFPQLFPLIFSQETNSQQHQLNTSRVKDYHKYKISFPTKNFPGNTNPLPCSSRKLIFVKFFT